MSANELCGVIVKCVVSCVNRWDTTNMSRTPAPINGLSQDNSFTANTVLLSSSTLGIIYSLIARGTTILAHHACCHGNFTEVAQQVLRSIAYESDRRLSYASAE